jgi:hypothetical protein
MTPGGRRAQGDGAVQGGDGKGFGDAIADRPADNAARKQVQNDGQIQLSTFPEPLRFYRTFFDWYNNRHHHSGTGLLAPQQVHSGRAEQIRQQRPDVLAAAHARHADGGVDESA